MSFEWGTVIVIMLIFVVFFYGAHRADQAVAAKAKENRAAMNKATIQKNKKQM